MIKVIYFIIYLTSFSEPKQAVLFAVDPDSLSYYNGDRYVKKKILHQYQESVYTFDTGYAHVGWKKVKIYRFSDNKPLVYQIRYRSDL